MNQMGEPKIKIVAMPKDTNPAGNIFGGWIMSQIDIAGALVTQDANIDNVVTVAINAIEFHEPIFVGDAVSFYAKILSIGNTSIKTAVEVTAQRNKNGVRRCLHVTSAALTYVAVDNKGNKQKINCEKNLRLALGVE